MARSSKVREIKAMNANAWYRLNNDDGSLSAVIAVDWAHPSFSLAQGELKRYLPSMTTEDDGGPIALVAEADIKRLMRPITYEEAQRLAPEFMDAVMDRSRG